MAKAPDLSAQVKDALPTALPTVEAVDAKLAELDEREAERRTQMDIIKQSLTLIQGERVAWKKLRDALAPEARKARVQNARDAVLACLQAGRDVTKGGLLSETNLAQSTLEHHLRLLIQDGKVVMVKRGLYRLTRVATPAPSPPPSPTTPRPSVVPHAAGTLQPLTAAAPKERCPVCAKPTWVDAIGTRDGLYVFRCPTCRTSFRERGGNADRP